MVIANKKRLQVASRNMAGGWGGWVWDGRFRGLILPAGLETFVFRVSGGMYSYPCWSVGIPVQGKCLLKSNFRVGDNPGTTLFLDPTAYPDTYPAFVSEATFDERFVTLTGN